jgi:hypothetical protein
VNFETAIDDFLISSAKRIEQTIANPHKRKGEALRGGLAAKYNTFDVNRNGTRSGFTQSVPAHG